MPSTIQSCNNSFLESHGQPPKLSPVHLKGLNAIPTSGSNELTSVPSLFEITISSPARKALLNKKKAAAHLQPLFYLEKLLLTF
jgi:hypothetical protein